MKSALLPLAALLVAGCVSSGPQSQIGTEQKAQQKQQYKLTRTSDCVFQSAVSDFNALDDTHVVLYGGGRRKAYLAELEGGCFDIRSQSALAATEPAARLWSPPSTSGIAPSSSDFIVRSYKR